MAVKKWNPKKLTGSWSPGTVTIQPVGFMDGSFLEVSFNEEAVTVHVGADGVVSYILSANEVATLTLTLAQTSPSCAALSAQAPNAAANRLPSGPMSWRDLNGNTLIESQDVVLAQVPKAGFGKSIEGRQFKFFLPHAKIVLGDGGQ